MSLFQLKLIAIVTMLIDHIGLLFFPNIILFRIIGRLAFPLFAFTIANGAYHTHNIRAYLFRLIIFAFISQIPFALTVGAQSPVSPELNIFFTLALGLIAIMVMQKTTSPFIQLIAAITTALIATLINSDYGAVGVFSIIFFYRFFHDYKRLIISQAFLFTVPFALELSNVTSLNYLYSNFIQPWAIIAVFLIMLYNDKQGRRLKYFFYLFYPLHLLLLFFIQSI